MLSRLKIPSLNFIWIFLVLVFIKFLGNVRKALRHWNKRYCTVCASQVTQTAGRPTGMPVIRRESTKLVTDVPCWLRIIGSIHDSAGRSSLGLSEIVSVRNYRQMGYLFHSTAVRVPKLAIKIHCHLYFVCCLFGFLAMACSFFRPSIAASRESSMI